MPIRDFGNVRYVPLLSVRPAEMKALEELPDRDKDGLLPYVCLRPWVNSHHLDSTLARVEQAYGHRPYIADVTSNESIEGVRRPVHEELDNLRVPINGYANWCEFLEPRANLIPALLFTDLSQIAAQARRLTALDRGLVVRLPEQAFGQSRNIAAALSKEVAPETVCVILDFEKQTNELLVRQVPAITLISGIQQALPGCFIAIAASSFPELFTQITRQDIYERQFFNGIVAATGGKGLIYGDHGSARVERQGGGGGLPAPRIDYPIRTAWNFYREEEQDDRLAAYTRAAVRAMDADDWDANLRLWGSQMIEHTALAHADAINSPMRSTSVRINIHLHRQLFYGAPPEELYDTDEDWSDL